MKYLIKSSYNILDNPTVNDIYNIDGLNFASNIFSYSISRTLMKEGDTIDTLDGKAKTMKNLIAHPEILEGYDFIILPLADFIKSKNFELINYLVQIIEATTKPVICPNLTIRYDFNDESIPAEFEEPTKKLIDALLKKSTIVGIRDEYCAQYLESLGYKRDQDFEVVGAMGMYTFGDTLPQLTAPTIADDSKIAVNANYLIPQYAKMKQLHKFFINNTKDRDYSYFPGRIEEVTLDSLSYPSYKSLPKYLKDSEFSEEIFTHYNACANMKTLFNEVKNYDFCFGSRIQQCISAIISGVPTVVVACDYRMKGVCEFHNIPFVLGTDVTPNMSIYDKISEMDFTKIQENHKANFDKYIAFLHKNGLTTIYDDPTGACYFDTCIENNVDLIKLDNPTLAAVE